MRLLPRVSKKAMKRSIAVLIFLSGTAVTVGCGQVLSEDDRTCPCATGWICCSNSNKCAQDEASCSSTTPSCGPKNEIDLGTETIVGGDASPMVETVTGNFKGNLAASEPVAFDYAMSIWPNPNGFGFSGWVVAAEAGQSFTFKLWSEPADAGPTTVAGSTPLPLIVYGPLEGVTAGSCVAAATDAGVMQGGVATWSAPSAGEYFVVPYHAVFFSNTNDAGLSLDFSDFESPLFANAYIQMVPPQ
jgi:hypothetical protein